MKILEHVATWLGWFVLASAAPAGFSGLGMFGFSEPGWQGRFRVLGGQSATPSGKIIKLLFRSQLAWNSWMATARPW